MSVNYIQQLLESYNQKASERDSNQIQEWKVRERENFMKYLSDEKVTNLLEIGAGPGKDSQFFNQQGLATFSTDLSPEMVKICRNKGLEAEVMNFSNLQFANEQFDAVWALNCLLHVPKQELRDVLLEINV